MGVYFEEGKGEFHTGVNPNKNNGTLMLDKMHRYTKRMKSFKCNIHNRCNFSWMWHLSTKCRMNVKSKHKSHIKWVNPKHNIFCEQIGQEPRLVDDMVNPIRNLSEELAPSRHPHHKRPNLWWMPRFLMRDGPSLIGLPPHVWNPTHIGPKYTT
jgi:hypothetical protein